MNDQLLFDELLANIAAQDPIKARMVLLELHHLEPKSQDRLLFELNKTDEAFSIPILLRLLSSDEPGGRHVELIRSMLTAKLLDRPDLLITFLNDEHLADKQVLIETAAELQLDDAVPALLDLLARQDDQPQLLLSLWALGEIGNAGAVGAVSDFLYATDRKLVQAAATALALMRTETALQRIYERLGTDRELDDFLLQTIAAVQEQPAMELLNTALQSHHAHLRTRAKTLLADLGPKAIPMLLANLRSDSEDLVLHSLNILGILADPSIIQPIKRLLHDHPENPNVRFAAYEALGTVPIKTSAYVLVDGLNDSDASVRNAAASAIDNKLDDYLLMGIKNILSSGGADAEQLMDALISMEAVSVVLALLPSPPFVEFAIPKIATGTTPEVRERYLNLFDREGFQSISQRIRAATPTAQHHEGPLVYVVDDSRMLLNIYRNDLYKLGIQPELFEFPAQALEACRLRKPDVLFTDLNMPDLNGIELTQAVRQLYSEDELPIIMVTTQKESHDHRAARKAGVTRILLKPFNSTALEQMLDDSI